MALMMKKYSVILIVNLIAFIAIIYLWSAILAKKKSDDLRSKFKEIDSSLIFHSDSTHTQKGIGAVEKLYPISLMKSEIILLIDSLKENYERIPESSRQIETSKQLHLDIVRLLQNILQFNKLKWDMVDSRMPDTIKYCPGLDRFSEQKWFSTYFNNISKEASITYLNYLKNQIRTIN